MSIIQAGWTDAFQDVGEQTQSEVCGTDAFQDVEHEL